MRLNCYRQGGAGALCSLGPASSCSMCSRKTCRDIKTGRLGPLREAESRLVCVWAGAGASCALQIGADGFPCTQGWVLGTEPISQRPTEFLLEGGLLRPLLVAAQYILKAQEVAEYIVAHTGNRETSKKLLH